METVKGIYAEAKIYTTNNKENALDDYARAQLQAICDNKVSEESIIRVMPDVHPGKVGTIGLTMTVGKAIMPNLIGIDIGCGMSMVKIKKKKLEFQKLDKVIRENIPVGSDVRKNIHAWAEDFAFDRLNCVSSIRLDKAKKSLGTLGGGNHFIEIDQSEQGELYILVHSGSRHLGKEVTEFYLNQGQKVLKERGEEVPYELTYLEGNLMEAYLQDLQVLQEYASLNREIMIREILKGMKLKAEEEYDCIHNYVDFSGETPLLRKGAISAKQGELCIIPINMKDGVILARGRGNSDWNMSAPHGSGRVTKRTEVANQYTVSAFKSEMKGIYSSCIGKDTLDEAPMAYRNMEDMLEVIGDTVEVEQILRPVYNFKAGRD